MKKIKLIQGLAKKRRIIKAKDLEEHGVTRNYLYRMSKQGLLIKVARGMYSLPNVPVTENQDILEVAKKIPNAVVCLISALNFYEITTQIPNEIWIAVPRDSWRPKIEYPIVHYTVLSEKTYKFGIDAIIINGISVKIYSPAKTVADCFKFRNVIGLDVAIEALKEGWKHKKFSMDELHEASKINRVLKIMQPYIQAIV
jgi:predicted transcriptional regulator of viral defense system